MPLHTMSGSMQVRGCFKTSRTYNVLYRFAEGSVVYRTDKAQRGVLEKIAIKGVRIVRTRETFNFPMVIYVDTFNALYDEGDLCTHAEALAYATAYLTRVAAEVQAEIDRLNCP